MKLLNYYILEKLKINSKTKLNKEKISIHNFLKFIENENNNPFGKSLNEIKNNKIEIGKCYNISHYANTLIYIFPFYLTEDKFHYNGINLTYKEVNKIDKKYNDEQDYCILQYITGTYNKITNNLKIEKLLSTKTIQDYGEDIYFNKYIKIIEDLYNISKKCDLDDFLNKYEQIIDERS